MEFDEGWVRPCPDCFCDSRDLFARGLHRPVGGRRNDGSPIARAPRYGLLLALAIPVAFLFMPTEWWGRMSSIGEYEADTSATGRLTIWAVCAKIGLSSVFGGGFSASEYRQRRLAFRSDGSAACSA